MTAFFCDLDNTLIYSARHDIGTEKTCAEWYDGREASFMRSSSAALLQILREKLLFVPTTTRSLEQFSRIRLGFAPEFALACNGGILLHGGKIQEDWRRESLKLIDSARSELCAGASLLEADPNRSFDVRWVEELFVFTKSAAPEETISLLREKLPCREINVFQNGSKVYLMPRALDKGSAAHRLCKRLGIKKSYAAGDSLFDLPMLERADCAFAPRALFSECSGLSPHILSLPEPFCENFLTEILRRIDTEAK